MWTMAIEIQGTTATPSLELVQEGEKTHRHLRGPVRQVSADLER
jgi:hypothetical protein